MRRFDETHRLLRVAIITTLLGLLAVQTDTVADSLDNLGVQVVAASGEPNDLRWDLAKGNRVPAVGVGWSKSEGTLLTRFVTSSRSIQLR
jgi:hypothetical protein